MAWRSSAASNAKLVHNLKANKMFSSPRIESAMLAVDRADFIPESPKHVARAAYEDAPQPLEASGATISAPHMHAIMLNHLKGHLTPGARVLDVGSGSGYLTAVMAEMVRSPAAAATHDAREEQIGSASAASAASAADLKRRSSPKGFVYGIEHIGTLVKFSRAAIAKQTPEIRESCEIVQGDGRLGFPEGGPYDVIHVGAAARELPRALMDQLRVGGRMVIPVGDWSQDLLTVDRVSPKDFKETRVSGVMFVPLTDRSYYPGQG